MWFLKKRFKIVFDITLYDVMWMVSYQYLAVYELSFLAALFSLTYISANGNNRFSYLFFRLMRWTIEWAMQTKEHRTF